MMKKLINGALFVRAFFRLIQDPNQLDMVFALADNLDDNAYAQLMARPEVKEFLQKVESGASSTIHVNLASLSALPPGTLGRTMADWMNERGLSPDSLMPGEVKQAVDHVKNHLATTHDIWHVAAGFQTDVAGEVGLQAFYLAQLQTPLSLAIFSAMFLNAIFIEPDDTDRRMDALVRGWQLGKQAKPFFGTNWEALWQMPMDELRRELGIDVGVEPVRRAADAATDTTAKAKAAAAAA